MRNKKLLIILIIAIVVIFSVIIFVLNRPSEIEKQEKELAKEFENLNNQVVEVTYNKTTDQLTSNATNLGNDFTVAIDDYKYNENDDSKLKLTLGFTKGNTELLDVMYNTILYNKNYFFYGLDFKQYKEFKNLKDYSGEYEQGCGIGITRINGEEQQRSKLIEDMIVFSFYEELELNDLSFSLYNIKYKPEADTNWHMLDNQRVTFNISIEE